MKVKGVLDFNLKDEPHLREVPFKKHWIYGKYLSLTGEWSAICITSEDWRFYRVNSPEMGILHVEC